MAVEIEKPAVSFTGEAEMALNRSVSRLERRLRAKAANLAIKSRGTPAEVTGSDVERAYRDVLRLDIPERYEDKLDDERRLRRLRRLHLVSMMYMLIGLVIAVAGGLYPYVHEHLGNPTFRLSVATVSAGLAVSGVGFFLREYTRQRDLARKEEALRKYSRFIVPRKESE